MAVAVASGVRSALRYKARVAQALLRSGCLAPRAQWEAPTQGMNQAGIAGLTLKPLAVRLMNKAMPIFPAGRHGRNILPPGRRASSQCTGGLMTPALT